MHKGPTPPQQQQVKIDLSLAEDVNCTNCGNYTFTPVAMLKRISAIQSPTGQSGIIPLELMACNACGFVNDEFLPPQMRKNPEEPQASAPTPTTPTKSGLTLI